MLRGHTFERRSRSFALGNPSASLGTWLGLRMTSSVTVKCPNGGVISDDSQNWEWGEKRLVVRSRGQIRTVQWLRQPRCFPRRRGDFGPPAPPFRYNECGLGFPW